MRRTVSKPVSLTQTNRALAAVGYAHLLGIPKATPPAATKAAKPVSSKVAQVASTAKGKPQASRSAQPTTSRFAHLNSAAWAAPLIASVPLRDRQPPVPTPVYGANGRVLDASFETAADAIAFMRATMAKMRPPTRASGDPSNSHFRNFETAEDEQRQREEREEEDRRRREDEERDRQRQEDQRRREKEEQELVEQIMSGEYFDQQQSAMHSRRQNACRTFATAEAAARATLAAARKIGVLR